MQEGQNPILDILPGFTSLASWEQCHLSTTGVMYINFSLVLFAQPVMHFATLFLVFFLDLYPTLI